MKIKVKCSNVELESFWRCKVYLIFEFFNVSLIIVEILFIYWVGGLGVNGDGD